MQIITDKIKAFQRLDEGLSNGEIYKSILKEKENIILDWNRNEQLFRDGINNDGTKIPDYMVRTVNEHKIPKRQPWDRVTLRDTGKFHASFYLEFTDQYFRIFASDVKTTHIMKPYIYGRAPRGPKVLGLTPQNQQRLLNEILIPGLYRETRKILN